jgi:hypothetical protein
MLNKKISSLAERIGRILYTGALLKISPPDIDTDEALQAQSHSLIV